MTIGRSLALCAVLWSAAASAEPQIVDPTPDDDTTDWQLALEPSPVVAGLASPTGLVFVGMRKDEDLLVIEKDTGRVRHYKNDALGSSVEQDVALDLGVDTCGDRGLLSIALHPAFDRSTPATSDPDAPEKDWVYLAFHTDEPVSGGGTGDGCDADAVYRVVRYTWNGTTLVDPVQIYSRALADGETTALGGAIAIGREIDLEQPDFFDEMIYIAIGSLGRSGSLQNNKALTPPVLDDTSVVLRLRALDGSTPKGNPFDADEDAVATEDPYFAYGFRDLAALVIDPATTYLWASERSDAGKDELNLFLSGTNGGYSVYQGLVKEKLPPNLDEDGQPNPDYPLFDLQTELKNGVRLPVSTYLTPNFTFLSPDVRPTGLAFGGTEVGPLHQEDLFVGAEDGRLFRFDMNAFRLGFQLAAPLADTVADLGLPEDDPTTPDVDETEPDSLTQILIAEGFGAISDLETGIDGSLYVVDRSNGTIHRIFYDAVRNLAVQSVKAPAKISLSAKKPVVHKAIRVTLVNLGEVAERIESRDELTNLLGLEISSPTGCAAPIATVVDPKYALPPYPYLIGIAPNGGRLSLSVDVAWTCESPFDAGADNFETRLAVDLEAIGVVELPENLGDNVCPRPPDPLADPPDPGCGAKQPDKTLGGPIVTDITIK
jgi:glucose/arabinose dehydrogenase